MAAARDVEPRRTLFMNPYKMPEQEGYTLAFVIARERTLVEANVKRRASRTVPAAKDLDGVKVVMRADHHPRIETLLDLPRPIMRVEWRGIEVRETLTRNRLDESLTLLFCKTLDLTLSNLLCECTDGLSDAAEVWDVRLV